MIEIKRLGHASVMVKVGDNMVYIDPWYNENLGEEIKKIYEDPEKADIVLITHEHRDHCDPSSIKEMIKDETKIAAPKTCSEKLDMDFIGMGPGDTTEIDDVDIEAVWAYNVKRKRDSGVPFHPKGEGVGYMITYHGKTIYHAGDTEKIEEMHDIGDVDLAFLPIDGTYTMDIDEAIEASKVIGTKVVVPIHERDSDPMEFKEKVESTSEVRVEVMRPGEIFELE